MTDNFYFKTEKLSVGYNGKILISDIDINLKKGEILTLIGPNGSGKSTILKTITGHLSAISGLVYIDFREFKRINAKELASRLSVVLTERIKPELMSCADVVAMGRYPYTNYFGKLTCQDMEIVRSSLQKVNSLDLADTPFDSISDGQRQRIMLARAICQEPEIIVLDEPTSFLDIRYKIEILDSLRFMAKNDNITIIMSLHDIDLAQKISDYVFCVKGEKITCFGRPEEVFTGEIIKDLYDIKNGFYNMDFGSIELAKSPGVPEVFVVCGAGLGIGFFRILQRKNIPFYAGILYDNDIDFSVSKALSYETFYSKAFERVPQEIIDKALKALDSCEYIIDSKTPVGEYNNFNKILIDEARKKGKTIIEDIETLRKIFGSE